MLRVGIIGLGDISKVHVAAINDISHAELVAVCDIDSSLQSSVKGVPFYTDYQVMLEEVVLDCVHICLPHHLHYPATKAAVENGVHVMLEKPLAHNLADSRAIVELEEKHPEVKICVSLQNRLNETVEELASLVSQGKYGEVTGLKGIVTWHRPKSYYDAKPWRGSMETAGGGVMINQSIHTLDLLQWFGGKITSIRGSIDRLLDYGYDVEDTATAHIKYQNGATGLFFATISNAQNSSVEFQVVLEKAKLTIKDSILTVAMENGEKVKLVEDRKLPGSKFYYGASHSKLIDQFYQEIMNDSNHYIHAKDAQVSMEMIHLIRESSEAKHTMNMELYQDHI
ncbi:gfo/Idh/MocA family oxidoreductase [Gracilibacillus salitolerans]|uniref:Gfo/Idh/MocA family oxidoreductase n=1 Tax=Gracilibacillus salitolerans TaxID=2663022 RepID=A0A5Q2TIG5_9BACI|nr:Gfo/Idh/MocA family oxidoreductase [Gracilibacillus salitolerans]QGH33822.1 gfo/Idh/MocA family oxidoreductase [Gracilibacillus salitolerans]